MSSNKRTKTAQPAARSRSRKASKTAAPPKAKPPRHPGGRKRLAPTSGFARWLDNRKLADVSTAVGLSESSLYQIRRGEQGLSMDKLEKLVAYAGGVLTLADFKPGS
jgi:hypothetical protein